ncbi:hypothetical protein KP509_12G024600 [Ceratopteris richardii]|uniref:Uncharacterized protein n=1 Tax=Ceratopteris richardii TaxID=49495 RepID=A0A8T2TM29_CERRI|nr:hypothetical protein KP509_12G024600 [Ceratopteris richardii]
MWNHPDIVVLCLRLIRGVEEEPVMHGHGASPNRVLWPRPLERSSSILPSFQASLPITITHIMREKKATLYLCENLHAFEQVVCSEEASGLHDTSFSVWDLQMIEAVAALNTKNQETSYLIDQNVNIMMHELLEQAFRFQESLRWSELCSLDKCCIDDILRGEFPVSTFADEFAHRWMLSYMGEDHDYRHISHYQSILEYESRSYLIDQSRHIVMDADGKRVIWRMYELCDLYQGLRWLQLRWRDINYVIHTLYREFPVPTFADAFSSGWMVSCMQKYHRRRISYQRLAEG